MGGGRREVGIYLRLMDEAEAATQFKMAALVTR